MMNRLGKMDMMFNSVPRDKRWLEPKCNPENSELFFSGEHSAKNSLVNVSGQQAIALCRACPFYDENDAKNDCLQYAISHDEQYGIWGGKTARERQAIKRRYNIGASKKIF